MVLNCTYYLEPVTDGYTMKTYFSGWRCWKCRFHKDDVLGNEEVRYLDYCRRKCDQVIIIITIILR